MKTSVICIFTATLLAGATVAFAAPKSVVVETGSLFVVNVPAGRVLTVLELPTSANCGVTVGSKIVAVNASSVSGARQWPFKVAGPASFTAAAPFGTESFLFTYEIALR